MEKDKNYRLGSKYDCDDVITHPFFKSLDIEKLLKKKHKPPLIPEVGKYFNNTSPDVEESVVPIFKVKEVQQNQDLFKEFDTNNIMN